MKRQTQTLLYHLLPVTFWLLAIGGIVLWELFFNASFSFYHYLPAVLSLWAVSVIYHISRHKSAVEPCFKMALLLGIAAYWLPSILFLVLPLWVYLLYRSLLDLRSLLSSFIGVATVAVWVAVLNFLHLIPYTFHLAYQWHLWIPTGAVLLAWLGSTIVRQTLRVR